MKNFQTTAFKNLNEQEIKKLTTVISETVAGNLENHQTIKTFSAAGLWNIQRKSGTRYQRRFLVS